jgi:Sec-independent protein translocase protein TatA
MIALIVLGPKRLPETARAIGKGMREMRDALSGDHDEDEEEEDERVEDEVEDPVLPPATRS